MTFNYKGVDYEMKDTLRVCYAIQASNNHKPYKQVFEEMGDMPIESQIDVLYASFNLANPGVAKSQEFRDYVMDEMGLNKFQETLGQLMDALMYHGMSPEEIATKKTQQEAAIQK